jgi:hypothetical protein
MASSRSSHGCITTSPPCRFSHFLTQRGGDGDEAEPLLQRGHARFAQERGPRAQHLRPRYEAGYRVAHGSFG